MHFEKLFRNFFHNLPRRCLKKPPIIISVETAIWHSKETNSCDGRSFGVSSWCILLYREDFNGCENH